MLHTHEVTGSNPVGPTTKPRSVRGLSFMASSTPQRLSRLEPWLFGALVLLHAVPVLAFTWFPTLDGPAHLYNARIIGSLLSGDAATARFFELDPFPEPNWLGHALMTGMMAVSTAQMAEKTVMLLYVIGLPLSFRFALRRLNAPDLWAAVLIFPFIYGFTFRIGFLNFSLGLPLLLLALGTGPALARSSGGRAVVPMMGLLTALYFAHLTCFLLAVALLFTMSVQRAITERRTDGITKGPSLPGGIKKTLLAAAPGLLLCIAFFLLHQDKRSQLKHLSTSELFTGLLNGRPFVALSDSEEPFARTMAWAMAALTLAALITTYRHSRSERTPVPWLVTGIPATLLAYFVFPDQMATGGFISVRLLLFAYLIWSLWLGLQAIPGWFKATALATLCATELLLLRVQYAYTEGLNAELSEVLAIAPELPEHAVVLPLNYSGNWLHSNFPCYLGAIRNAEVLDNFGARTPHMPVRWRNSTDPSEAVGSFATSDRPCVDLDVRTREGSFLIDHVVTYKLNASIVDSCTDLVRAQLRGSFVEVAVSPGQDARLYRRR